MHPDLFIIPGVFHVVLKIAYTSNDILPPHGHILFARYGAYSPGTRGVKENIQRELQRVRDSAARQAGFNATANPRLTRSPG